MKCMPRAMLGICTCTKRYQMRHTAELKMIFFTELTHEELADAPIPLCDTCEHTAITVTKVTLSRSLESKLSKR